MKKLAAIVTALIFGVSLLLPATSFASNVNPISQQHKSEITTIDDSDFPIIVPYSNQLVINSQSIQGNGVSWNQPQGYGSYRVWVQNNTDDTMQVVIRCRGWIRSEFHTMSVKPRSGQFVTVNDAMAGTHTIDFSTTSGYLNGTVSVRISDESL